MITYDLILLCAGRGERFGNQYKPFLEFNKMPLFMHSMKEFNPDKIIVTRPRNSNIKLPKSNCDYIKYVYGGGNREESIVNALKHCKSEYVVIHDGVRPFLSQYTVESLHDLMNDKKDIIMTYSKVDRKLYDIDSQDLYSSYGYMVNLETPQVYRRVLLTGFSKHNRVEELLENDDLDIFYLQLPKFEALKLTYPYQKEMFERLLK